MLHQRHQFVVRRVLEFLLGAAPSAAAPAWTRPYKTHRCCSTVKTRTAFSTAPSETRTTMIHTYNEEQKTQQQQLERCTAVCVSRRIPRDPAWWCSCVHASRKRYGVSSVHNRSTLSRTGLSAGCVSRRCVLYKRQIKSPGKDTGFHETSCASSSRRGTPSFAAHGSPSFRDFLCVLLMDAFRFAVQVKAGDSYDQAMPGHGLLPPWSVHAYNLPTAADEHPARAWREQPRVEEKNENAHA